jgi:signal transduction histidine kinase
MPTPSATHSARILIVDDDIVFRSLCRRRLQRDERSQNTCEEVGTAVEALSALSPGSHDCLLVDYRLPEMLGTELIESMRAKLGEEMPPVIVLTADGGENAATHAVRVSAADFMSKEDAGAAPLCRSVRNAVEQGRLRAGMRRQSEELVAANSELLNRAREIDRFYHTVSHEMKTPLTGARDMVAIVRDELLGGLTDEQREVLDDALVCCDQLTRQFHDLLDMTRLETGKLSLSVEPTPLDTLVRRCLTLASAEATRRSITLERHGETDLPDVLMDGSRISQVISNLLNNAIKFTEAGGRVRLVVRRLACGERVSVRIVDTGQGIERAHCRRIFERLYQVDEHGIKGTGGGMGLGLSIARDIMDGHGESLRVYSRPGTGSSFALTLRIAS